jgi:hypothetical protein
VYDRCVARQEQLYAGQVSLDGGEPVFGEVWHADGVAVVYVRPDNHIVGPMRDLTIDYLDGGLRLIGEVDGQTVTWAAVTPERVLGTWRDSAVKLADGGVVTGLVQQTNHGVTVQDGERIIQLAGARVRTMGGRAAQIEAPGGSVMPMTLPKRGCGCGGAK